MTFTCTVDLDAWPLSFDPFDIVDFNQALVLDAVIDPLLREGAGAGPVPSCAAGIVPVDDGRRWLLRLREGLRWPDGSPITAGHVAAGVHRVCGPTGVHLPSLRRPGERATVRGAAVSADTVEIRSEYPIPFMPELLTFLGAGPVRSDGERWTGSGPYRATGVDRHAGRIELSRQEARTAERCGPDRLSFRVYGDRAAALTALDDGRLDVSLNTGLPPEDFSRLAEHPRSMVRPLSMVAQLWVHPTVAAVLGHSDGRRLLSETFDRAAVAAASGGALIPLRRYRDLWRTPQGRGAGPAVPAERVSAGPRGELRLIVADFPPNHLVAAVLAAHVHSGFGHVVRPVVLPYERFARAAAHGDYDLMYGINPAPVPHVAALLTALHSSSPYARSVGLRDDTVDAVLEQVLRSGDPDWDDAEDRVLAAAPVIPLFQVNSVTAWASDVDGIDVAPSGALAWQRIARPAGHRSLEGAR
ncbi:ABC transporter substrate-binding protein [Dactylosporangium sp. NPDC005555]|uniref:ABC transporter substrate-binding protein n=1 Tax=Dactylosporangium sp. NPDC005555 TaxID=3154889 RepID=UPI0033AB0FE9